MKKRIIIPTTLLITLILLSTYAVRQVKAEDFYPPIITRLAEKFDLDEKSLEEVFEQERAERYMQKRNRFAERLTNLVQEGTITEAQKQLIIDKKDELQADAETRRLEHQQEMKAWAKENNINWDAIGIMGMGGRHFSR